MRYLRKKRRMVMMMMMMMMMMMVVLMMMMMMMMMMMIIGARSNKMIVAGACHVTSPQGKRKSDRIVELEGEVRIWREIC